MKSTFLKILGLLLVGAIVLFSGFGSAYWNTRPVIVTTMFYLYDFTKNIVGDKAEVVLLIPPGAEVHGWEPGPADLIKVKNAKLFIYNGADLEPWIDKMGDTVLQKKRVVNASTAVSLLEAGEHQEHGHEHSSASHHEHGRYDPHIWLDPVNAQAIVKNIAAAVAAVDPANAGYYDNNAARYNSQLEALHQEYSQAIAPAAGKEIVTTHTAFGYLARRYGLKQSSIMGIEPHSEPAPEQMVQIIRHVKKRGIQYIFTEPLLSPKLSQVIAAETGAQTLALNPIGGLTEQDMAQGMNYLLIMRQNLQNLKIALGVH